MFVYVHSRQEKQKQWFQDLVDLETKRIYTRVSESENTEAAFVQDTRDFWLPIVLGRSVKYIDLTFSDA
jgi:hypothetical protein